MKITMQKKKVEAVKEIDWKALPKGVVVEFRDGLRAMTYVEKKKGQLDKPALLLLLHDGEDSRDGSLVVYEQARGYLEEPVVKVIGKITEIIVEEK